MTYIKDQYPALSMDHVRLLAQLVAMARNGVVAINKIYRKAGWGLACLCCNVVRDMVKDADASGEYPWLRYIGEKGLAYTVVVDGVPLRIQPDVEEIRVAMAGERALLSACQELLFATSEQDGVLLRLEVLQRPGDQVRQITLFLFEEHSGATLDCVIVYSGEPAKTLTFTRPAQDVDTSGLFSFHADNDLKIDDSK